jgi:hypothetical protein
MDESIVKADLAKDGSHQIHTKYCGLWEPVIISRIVLEIHSTLLAVDSFISLYIPSYQISKICSVTE